MDLVHCKHMEVSIEEGKNKCLPWVIRTREISHLTLAVRQDKTRAVNSGLPHIPQANPGSSPETGMGVMVKILIGDGETSPPNANLMTTPEAVNSIDAQTATTLPTFGGIVRSTAQPQGKSLASTAKVSTQKCVSHAEHKVQSEIAIARQMGLWLKRKGPLWRTILTPDRK